MGIIRQCKEDGAGKDPHEKVKKCRIAWVHGGGGVVVGRADGIVLSLLCPQKVVWIWWWGEERQGAWAGEGRRGEEKQGAAESSQGFMGVCGHV